ncbi:MAG: DUF1826 domain-containing protein [Rhodospirillales bacterium]
MSANRIVAGDTIDVLARIADPDVDLAIWHRPAPALVEGWLAQAPPAQLPHGRVLVRRSALDDALAAVFAESSVPASLATRRLADDIAMLTRAFAVLACTDEVDVRLETVTDDGCWKFHRDYVTIRLLASYLGPGTQWVAAADAEAALLRQRDFGGPVGQLPRFAAGVFRGARGAPDTGMVHRSPPIAGSGTMRLLLALSPPSAASPQPWRPGVPATA